jgi:hypothetical protein
VNNTDKPPSRQIFQLAQSERAPAIPLIQQAIDKHFGELVHFLQFRKIPFEKAEFLRMIKPATVSSTRWYQGMKHFVKHNVANKVEWGLGVVEQRVDPYCPMRGIP